MFVKIIRKRNFIVSLAAVLMILIVVAALFFINIYSKPSYVGKTINTSIPDTTETIQISNVAMSIPPKPPTGMQANIKISKFAGEYAMGYVIYTNKSPSQQFMVVKSSDGWKVIAHNTGKKLDLPNVATAIKYQLPKGWYNE